MWLPQHAAPGQVLCPYGLSRLTEYATQLPVERLVCRTEILEIPAFLLDAGHRTIAVGDIFRKARGMQSPYTTYSPVSWYNREESHSGQLYHLHKAVLSLCPEYDTSLRYCSILTSLFEFLINSFNPYI